MNSNEMKQLGATVAALGMSIEEAISIEEVTNAVDKETMDVVASAIVSIATRIYCHAHPDLSAETKAEFDKFVTFMRNLSTEETNNITNDLVSKALDAA